MLRKVIDLNQVEIWKCPDTYKKGLNFDLLVVRTSHSLHKVAIRKFDLGSRSIQNTFQTHKKVPTIKKQLLVRSLVKARYLRGGLRLGIQNLG